MANERIIKTEIEKSLRLHRVSTVGTYSVVSCIGPNGTYRHYCRQIRDVFKHCLNTIGSITGSFKKCAEGREFRGRNIRNGYFIWHFGHRGVKNRAGHDGRHRGRLTLVRNAGVHTGIRVVYNPVGRSLE